MSLIPGYPAGSNISLINTFYQYPKRNPTGKGYTDDILTVIFRDNDTGEKKSVDIHCPEYTYYIANDDVDVCNKELFIHKDDCRAVTVKYSDVLKSIATETGNLDYFYGNIKNGNRKENDRLHEVTGIFNSDMNYEDYFRVQFIREYGCNSFKVSKAFFDIETRMKNVAVSSQVPEAGSAPISALTYINNKHEVLTFLLRDKENDQIEQFEQDLKSGKLFKELSDFVIDHVGGYKIASRIHKCHDFKYKIIMYDEEDEINLIKDFFAAVHADQPDFIMAWNASFDIPFLIERARVLGYNPEEICADQSFASKLAYYRLDLEHASVAAQKTDRYFISGYSVWDDQMRHFASRRRGQSAFPRFGLDFVGGKVAKVKKVDYHKLGATIRNIEQVNYKMFVFYNIVDVIVQYCIENISNDYDYIYNKCMLNSTQYHKCHRQMNYLTDRSTYEWFKDGYVISNNHNRHTEKPKEKFPGALVGDMRNVTNYARVLINGVFVNLAKNVNDWDYKSLYPSTAIQHNMAPHTQVGRIIIDQQVHPNENRFSYNKFSRGGAFIEDLESDNFVEFAHRWLHLADYKEMIHDINEFYTHFVPIGELEYKKSDMPALSYKPEIRPRRMFRYNPSIDGGPIDAFRTEYQKMDYGPLMTEIKENAQMTINSFEHIIRRKQNEIEEDIEFKKFLDSFDDTISDKPDIDSDNAEGGDEE